MFNRDLEYKSNGNIAKLTDVNKHRLRALRFFIPGKNEKSKIERTAIMENYYSYLASLDANSETSARIFRRIKEILMRGNNVEIRLNKNGRIAVYEVKKKSCEF